MSRISLSLLGAVALCAGGCVNSGNTQLPQLGFNDARYERAAAEYHDPFPETDVGPGVSARPRGFTTARSEPRRTLEGTTRASTGYRPSSNYPATVNP